MKKGFTVVELIITFSLAVVIATFLLQLVLSLNNLYQNSGIKTEILNKQFVISNKINKTLNEKELMSLTSCGNNCLNFNYSDNTKDIFKVDYSNNILQFGNLTTTLPSNTYFKNVNIDIIYSTTIDYDSNNAILNISIPIYNEKLNNEDFNVNIVYQYNSNKANISYVNFSGSDNYIVLKGDTEQTINSKTTYVEQGYTVYDKNGNVISGDVEIENPLTTAPYKSGRYIIKYNLKDKNGNIISQVTRSVEVEPSVYEITNLVEDGSLENGNLVFGSYASNASLSISDNKYKNGTSSLMIVPVDSNKTEAYALSDPIYNYELGHKYYYSINYISENNISLYFLSRTYDINKIIFSNSNIYSASLYWKKASIYIENRSSRGDIIDTSTNDMSLRVDNDNGGQYVEAYFDDVILIDLTETFGEGNEPSKEWCDENINWFEGTTKISY